MNRFSTGVTVLMLAIFTTMLLMALGFPPNARFMPLVVGLPGIGLCLLQLALDVRTARRARVAGPSLGNEEEEFGRQTMRMEVVSWLYFLLFIGGVLLFGFLIAAPVLIATYLRREARVRWPRALGAAGITALVLYFLFQQALGFRLFEGFIGEGIFDALNL